MRWLTTRINGRVMAALQGLRVYRRREDGSVAIEYAFLGPVYLLILLGMFEIAAISMSMTSIRVGLDNVGRQVRTGQAQCLSDDDAKRIICSGSMGSNCSENLEIERSAFSSGAAADAVSVDDWENLNADDIVLLSATYEWPIINPMLDPFLGRGEGSVPIRGAIVFKSESFANASCN